jgi:phosphatidyl-myo-inositol dimannoside synthase
VTSLLVTNDFPPKLGGIQSYLWELWRRLPAAETTVLTAAFDGAAAFDAAQAFRVERRRERVLLPRRDLSRRVNDLAREVRADVVFVDPMLPLGMIVPSITAAPAVLIAHGAEITVPGRSWPTRPAARRVLNHVAGVVAAGHYPLAECDRVVGRRLPAVVVPPGVDPVRFVPLAPEERILVRKRFDIDPDRPVVLGLSRLVPRKGFDRLIEAVAGPELKDVQLVIGGAGRDSARLQRMAVEAGIAARTRFLGRVADADLPAVMGMADVFVMLCRDRWRGLEAEGFGIVFLEAAACGVPAIAGRSGGSHEAVVDGETGFVVESDDVASVRLRLRDLIGDTALRAELGRAARERARSELSYDALVPTLAPVAAGDLAELRARA